MNYVGGKFIGQRHGRIVSTKRSTGGNSEAPLDEEMSNKADDLDQKEVENKSDGVEDIKAKLKLLKKKEENIDMEIEKLNLLKQETISERESLIILADELEKMSAEISQKEQQIHDENEKLKVKKELLLKEKEDLKQARKVFEVEWEALDLKRKALNNINYQKEMDSLSSKRGTFVKDQRDTADIDELVMLSEMFKDQLGRFAEQRVQFHEFVVGLKGCKMCGYIASDYVLSDELLEKISCYATNARRFPTEQNDLKSSQLSGCRVSWLQKCISRIFNLSPKTTKHLSQLGLADKTAARKRTRADQTCIMTGTTDPKAEAEGRKKRQTFINTSQNPGKKIYNIQQQFTTYKSVETPLIRTPGDGLDGNTDAADYEIVDFSKEANDTPEYNCEDEHRSTLQGDDGIGYEYDEDEDDDDDGDDDSEHPDETSVTRKIWNFFTS